MISGVTAGFSSHSLGVLLVRKRAGAQRKRKWGFSAAEHITHTNGTQNNQRSVGGLLKFSVD